MAGELFAKKLAFYDRPEGRGAMREIQSAMRYKMCELSSFRIVRQTGPGYIEKANGAHSNFQGANSLCDVHNDNRIQCSERLNGCAFVKTARIDTIQRRFCAKESALI